MEVIVLLKYLLATVNNYCNCWYSFMIIFILFINLLINSSSSCSKHVPRHHSISVYIHLVSDGTPRVEQTVTQTFLQCQFWCRYNFWCYHHKATVYWCQKQILCRLLNCTKTQFTTATTHVLQKVKRLLHCDGS